MNRKDNVWFPFYIFTIAILLNIGSCSPEPNHSRSNAKIKKEKLNTEIILYKVKKGDTLWSIAKKYKTTSGLIMKTNHRTDDKIRIGETIKICPGPFTIQIDKSERKLRFKRGEEVLFQYPIAVGRNNSTPVGKFKVRSKVVNPPWTNPETKEVIKFGDPRHRIGTRWIGFADGYGIHGTSNPKSIGTAASKGCIRMLNEDIEELFEMVSIGMDVIIKE